MRCSALLGLFWFGLLFWCVAAADVDGSALKALQALQVVWPWEAISSSGTTAPDAAATVTAVDATGSPAAAIAPPAPWNAGIEKLYAFPLLPLSKAPKPPTPYAPFKQPWTFLGGTGYLFILRYSATPVGPYSELFYLPGRYRPDRCPSFSNSSALSIQRMYVDSQSSLVAGRVNWGYPKELATFTWSNVTRRGGPAAESVIMRVKNTVVLNATFTVAVRALPAWVLTPEARKDLSDPTLQWPLNATSLANPAAAVPNLLASKLMPVLTIASVNASVLKLNSRTLTGVAGLTVAKVPLVPVLGYWSGSTVLPMPASLVC